MQEKALIDLQKSGAIVSFLAINTSLDTLSSFQPQLLLAPASLMKLNTTAIGFYQLGSLFDYKTKVILRGYQDNQKWVGDLILVGGGDPTLGSSYFPESAKNFFELILSELKIRNISEITGDIGVDASFFNGSNMQPSRMWEDMGNYYGALPNGLTYCDNSMDIFLSSPLKPEELCHVLPQSINTSNISFECKVLSASDYKDNAYCYGINGQNKWIIEGSIPVGQAKFKIKVTNPKPQLLLGNELKIFLLKNGIVGLKKVSEETFDTHQKAIKTLAIYKSPNLIKIASVLNKNSHNLYADHLFLTLSGDTIHRDWRTARMFVSNFWSEKLHRNYSMQILDGSGLSPFNTLSCQYLTDVLLYMYQSSNSDTYLKSLAIGGKDGTLQRMWVNSPAKDHVFGKSGSMTGVLGYAGYVKTKSNNTILFTVIINHFNQSSASIKPIIEKWVENLYLTN